MARIARLTRSSMLEVLGQEYVRTARAKGVSEVQVVLKHTLKNAAIPVITVIGLDLGTLLGGAVITETIFAWPGVGRLAVQAIANRDYRWCRPLFHAGLHLHLINYLVDMPALHGPARRVQMARAVRQFRLAVLVPILGPRAKPRTRASAGINIGEQAASPGGAGVRRVLKVGPQQAAMISLGDPAGRRQRCCSPPGRPAIHSAGHKATEAARMRAGTAGSLLRTITLGGLSSAGSSSVPASRSHQLLSGRAGGEPCWDSSPAIGATDWTLLHAALV
jgi:hypothetical protein